MKGSFANHAHTVIKTNGNFAVNHSLDFLKQLTSFGDKVSPRWPPAVRARSGSLSVEALAFTNISLSRMRNWTSRRRPTTWH